MANAAASTKYSSLEDQAQFQQEVEYCLARLEDQIQAVNPDSRKAAELEKALRILSSTKAPVIKKRQVMRNMFGDYREKMKLLEKKNAAAMMKSKFFLGLPKSGTSRYLRHSKSATTDVVEKKRAGSRGFVAADSTISLTAHRLQQFQISPADCNKVADVREDGSALCTDSSGMDASSGASLSYASDMAAVAGITAGSGFKYVPSKNEFRFNFDPSTMHQAGVGNKEDKMDVQSQGDKNISNHFVMNPSDAEFRFNFALEGGTQGT